MTIETKLKCIAWIGGDKGRVMYSEATKQLQIEMLPDAPSAIYDLLALSGFQLATGFTSDQIAFRNLETEPIIDDIRYVTKGNYGFLQPHLELMKAA